MPSHSRPKSCVPLGVSHRGFWTGMSRETIILKTPREGR